MEWWLVAVCVTFTGTSLAGLGLCLQKYSHKKRYESTDDPEGEDSVDACRNCTCPKYCCNRWWLMGISVFLCGHLLCFLALGLGTQSVLSCVNCWCLVITFVIAPILLHEVVTVFRALSVLFLITGCTLVIVYGPKQYREYNIELLKHSLSNVPVQIITFCCLATLIFLGTRAMVTAKRPRITVVQATLISAMLGWYSVLTAKCTAGLLWSTIYYRHNQFYSPLPWILAGAVVSLGVTNLHFLNIALEYGDAVNVIPLYEALAVTGQIFIGGIFFDEFSQLTTTEHLYFWLGVASVVGGVFAVSSVGPDIPLLQQALIVPPTAGRITPRVVLPSRSPPSNPLPHGERSQLQDSEPKGSYQTHAAV